MRKVHTAESTVCLSATHYSRHTAVLRTAFMHVHGSRSLTAEGAALAATTSAVDAADGGATELDEAALLAHLDPRGLATDEGIDRQMRAADNNAAPTRDSRNTGGV
jgi:hypothetical protein